MLVSIKKKNKRKINDNGSKKVYLTRSDKPFHKTHKPFHKTQFTQNNICKLFPAYPKDRRLGIIYLVF